MPYAWVPWTFPGALGLSRGFNCLVLDQEPSRILGALSGVFTAWLFTKNPSRILGALTRVFSTMVQDHGSTHASGMGTLDISRGPRHI